MSVATILDRLRGERSWNAFSRLTGCSTTQLRAAREHGEPLSSCCVHALTDLSLALPLLTKKEKWRLAVGDTLWREISGEYPAIVDGTLTFAQWVQTGVSMRRQGQKLGLEYSTIFHYRAGRFQHFTVRNAVSIVRKSRYHISLWSLIHSAVPVIQSPPPPPNGEQANASADAPASSSPPEQKRRRTVAEYRSRPARALP